MKSSVVQAAGDFFISANCLLFTEIENNSHFILDKRHFLCIMGFEIEKYSQIGGNKLASYNTKQKQLLIDWMTEHSDSSFTIDELSAKLSESADATPGKSTVYRLVDKMVADGTVKRFVKGNSRHFYYQLAGDDCKHHLHLKCNACGRLIHMSHEESEAIVSAVFGNDSFSVDSMNTTLVGTCKDCSAK